MSPELEAVDWSICTPEGSEREQLRRWAALPLIAKLKALEGMCDHARATVEWRESQGLPYFDPATGELVPGHPPRGQ